MNAVGGTAARIGGLTSLWLLLAARFAAAEVLAGAAAAGAALALTAAVRDGDAPRRGPGRVALGALARLPWRTLRESAAVFRFAWRRGVRGRRLHGGYRSVPFDDGGAAPGAPARRVLGTLLGSFAPNGYVVAAEGGTRRALLHRLVGGRRRARPGEEWPL